MTCSNTPVQGGDNSGASVDLLSPAAMTNAYFICHNVQVNLHSGGDRFNSVYSSQDLMFFRGFYWAGAEKKGKGKKKKRQKL